MLDHRARTFGAGELETLQQFAALAMAHLEVRARAGTLQRELHRRAHQVAQLDQQRTHAGALSQVAEVLAQDRSPEDALLRVAEVLGAAADVDWVGLISLSGGDGRRQGDAGRQLSGSTAWVRPGTGDGFPTQLELLFQASADGHRQGMTWQMLHRGEAQFVDAYAASPGALPGFVAAG